MYRVIRTAAYEPCPDHGPWTEDLHVMRLGHELHQELLSLHARTRTRKDRPLRLPTRRLNALLRAMAPGVVATGRGTGTDAQAPWLYAREPVPHEVIAPLLSVWAAGLVPADGDDGPGTADDLFDEIHSLVGRLPGWERETVDLARTEISPGGTAEPDPGLYSLLPEWIAFKLAQSPLRAAGRELAFRVVTADQGTELVSWPPLRQTYKGRTWYHSALLRITVQTVPFAARFRVHVSSSIRRWATRFDVPRRELAGTSVLLDAPLPWPEGPDRGHRLVENALAFDRERGGLVWRARSPLLDLPELDIVHAYPEPSEVFEAPEKWIDGSGGISAGIVYKPGLGPHGVAPGLMPQERAVFDTWVETNLSPELRRVPDLTRATRRNAPVLAARTALRNEAAREALKVSGRATALADALAGRPLDVDVRWQSPETCEALCTALMELTGLPDPVRTPHAEGERWEWKAPDIDVRVTVRPAGAMASPLSVATDRKRSRGVRFAEAVEARCAELTGHLGVPDGARGAAIVEIAARERFSAQDSDPKHALRVAYARAKRITQFVNPPDGATENLPHRARAAWLDLFRQLGAVSPPSHRVGDVIPPDLQYAALWLVRYTRKGPTRCSVRRLVAVRVRPEAGDCDGDSARTVEGWDADRSAWVPYADLLLAQIQQPESHVQEQPSVEQQIRTVLFQLRDRPTLLLAQSNNLRQGWPDLRNGALRPDMLSFGEGTAQRVSLYGTDLRVVLLRDGNGREEVPEWYAHDGTGKAGFSQGVWSTDAPGNRVFASTTDVPPTAVSPRGLRKLLPAVPAGATYPGKTAWNPVHLELTVLGLRTADDLAALGRTDELPDRPVDWATLAHQLRLHDDYPPLARPLPLHLARLVGEYVLPLAGEGENEPSAP
ncbi:pPIWI_RE module domain-containing protein [Streptomyces sp. NPDC090025]|uniref:pPIWI_RE module domain-containing protein n=1 Tax=Streptomyces sp. NPDC090025 TaxID=3365922 RepID=UPI0038367F77